jgi:hypothetical protein
VRPAIRLALYVSCLLFPFAPLQADDTAIEQVGGTIHPLAEHGTVRLESEHVHARIDPERRLAQVECVFFLRNTGPAARVPIGFPESEGGPFEDLRSFVDGEEVAVVREPSKGKAVTFWWTKEVEFGADETRVIRDVYSAPVGASSDGRYLFLYVLHTGSSWSGTIGAISVVIEFVGDRSPSDMSSYPAPASSTAWEARWHWTDAEPGEDGNTPRLVSVGWGPPEPDPGRGAEMRELVRQARGQPGSDSLMTVVATWFRGEMRGPNVRYVCLERREELDALLLEQMGAPASQTDGRQIVWLDWSFMEALDWLACQQDSTRGNLKLRDEQCALAPYAPEPHYFRLCDLSRLGRLDEALAEGQVVLQMCRDHRNGSTYEGETLGIMCRVLTRMGRVSDAESALEIWRRIDPERAAYRTGERCPASGRYQFDGYLDGSSTPRPAALEHMISVSKEDVLPPIRSSGKSCWWRLLHRTGP